MLVQHLPLVILSPVVRLAEDVGEVVTLHGLVIKEGDSQTGVQGPLDVHLLLEVDDGGKGCHSSRILLLLPGQFLCHKLRII